MMNTTISNKTAAYNGALVAVAGVFAYSLAVMVYIILRSSASIYNSMPSSERSAILWANGFSIAYSIAIFALLMAVVSSVAGAMAGVILRNALVRFNPLQQVNGAIWVSGLTAIGLLAILYFLLYLLLKERITFLYSETLLFWYVFPAVLLYVAAIVGGTKLNKQLKSSEKQRKQKYHDS